MKQDPRESFAVPPLETRLSKFAIASALSLPAAILAAAVFGMVNDIAGTMAGFAVVSAGVVLGIVGLREIAHSGNKLSGRGLAIFGIVAPVSLVAAAMLVAVLRLPSVQPEPLREEVIIAGPTFAEMACAPCEIETQAAAKQNEFDQLMAREADLQRQLLELRSKVGFEDPATRQVEASLVALRLHLDVRRLERELVRLQGYCYVIKSHRYEPDERDSLMKKTEREIVENRKLLVEARAKEASWPGISPTTAPASQSVGRLIDQSIN